MGSEILVVSVVGLLVGAIIGYILSKKFDLTKLTKNSKDLQKIVKDPDLLVEKLHANGKLLDVGDELKYSVIEKGGIKKVVLERIPPKVPEKKVPEKKVSPKKSKKKSKKDFPFQSAEKRRINNDKGKTHKSK